MREFSASLARPRLSAVSGIFLDRHAITELGDVFQIMDLAIIRIQSGGNIAREGARSFERLVDIAIAVVTRSERQKAADETFQVDRLRASIAGGADLLAVDPE